MKGFPWIQFYPRDWVADTRSLTLAAKGAWIDILSALHNSVTRGELTLEIEAWARLIGASNDETGRVIAELGNASVAEIVTLSNGRVTLKNRRMLREEKAREQTRLRVARHRLKSTQGDPTHIKETPFLLSSNGATPDRSQKPEARSHIIPSAEAEKKELGNAHKPREKNPLIEAIVFCHCGTIEGVPNVTWKFAQSALTQIKAVAPTVSPEEIKRRWANMKLRFDGECSPAALVKWWVQCATEPPATPGFKTPEPFKQPANMRA